MITAQASFEDGCVPSAIWHWAILETACNDCRMPWTTLGATKGVLQSKKIAVQKIIGKYLAFHGGVLLPLGLLQHSMHTAQCMYAYPSLHVQILFFFKVLQYPSSTQILYFFLIFVCKNGALYVCAASSAPLTAQHLQFFFYFCV
jgi:hypothetical protein